MRERLERLREASQSEVDLGSVELRLRYGATGRPEHLYCWRGRAEPAGALHA